MAFDKIIDSAKLDAAMTATANAIRGKTGATAKIAWNESSGFSSAISAIESGGSKVATGTVRINNPTSTSYASVTVSGLGFKPTQIIMYLSTSTINSVSEEESQGGYFYELPLYITYDSSGKTYLISTGWEEYEYEEWDTGETAWGIYDDVRANYSIATITPTSDGFTVKIGNYYNSYDTTPSYSYIAIG